MKFSAVLVLAATAQAAVLGSRFSNGAEIAAPRALDLAHEVRRASNASSASAAVVETRQFTNATSSSPLLAARQASNATAPASLDRRQLTITNSTNALLETRQAANATARRAANLKRANLSY